MWTRDSELSKGKGKIKNKEMLIAFSVICRNSQDAIRCLDYHFRFVYKNSNDLHVDDGIITLSRSKVDSRNFTANYLLMDGLREPLSLSDLKNDNLLRLSRIW